jgi:hypothetical protein
MTNYDWHEEYAKQRGREAYRKFINDVYQLLLKMQPGSFFQIEGNVKPENIDLFIKVCCLFIEEMRAAKKGCKIEDYYVFSDDYTKIIHHE